MTMESESLRTLGLVVLNYCSVGDTVRCVDGLLGFGSDFRVVVVDNLSPDGSYEVLRRRYEGRAFVDVVQTGRNGGYSYGNNVGMRWLIERYGCTVVGVLNPDVIIPRLEVLRVMKERLESDARFAVIGGMAVTTEHVFNPNYFGWDVPSAWKLLSYHCCVA